MSRVDDLVAAALKSLPEKPPEDATQAQKRAYSERMSAVLALGFADELRQRGLKGALPSEPGASSTTGAEKRMAGGIGAKQVDVSWSTEESGLLFGLSIKTINFRDRRSNNFQKNLTNRRGEMLFESTTLHRRFPFAVLFACLFLDWGAASDDTPRRNSTFENAHPRLRLFTGREDPAAREEQYERFYVALVDANPFGPRWQIYEAGHPKRELGFDEIMGEAVRLLAERNFDFYEAEDGTIRRVPS